MSAFMLLVAAATAADPYAAARDAMVRDQIERRGVRDERVLRAMRNTLRHLFVPSSLRPQAYDDHPLPIGYDATISQPLIVAHMTELLAPGASDRVLEIGTGSGYQAAILSQLAGKVYTLEIVPDLARQADALLKELGYANVTVKAGDGYKGWPEQAPFDRIIVTAAPAEVPKTLLAQLKPGGRLVVPVGESPWTQVLLVVDKLPDGSTRQRSAGGVMFVPMVSK